MPKIYDDSEFTGNVNVDVDKFKIVDPNDPNKFIRFNLDGAGSTESTLYVFNDATISDAETNTPFITNKDDFVTILFISGVSSTFQVTANRNPTSFTLIATGTTGVTIDNNGLISYDGTEQVFLGGASVYATNALGQGETYNFTLNIGTGFADNAYALFNSYNLSEADNTTLATWQDESQSGYDLTQATESKKPLVVDGGTTNGFKAGTKGIKFNGTTSYMSGTNFNLISGGSIATGEIWVAFRTNNSSPTQPSEIFHLNRNTGNFMALCLAINGEYGLTDGSGTFLAGTTANQITVFTNRSNPYAVKSYTIPKSTANGEVIILRIYFSGSDINFQFGKNETPITFNDFSPETVIGGSSPFGVGGQERNGTNYTDATLGALLYYRTVLSNADRDKNFDFLESLFNPSV